MDIIAKIHTDFPTKFGIPRQSSLVEELRGTVIFEPPYRNADALRGLEEFSHIWLIWNFNLTDREGWSPTVLPPKLGGKTRMGVFATRSPFRPNPIGLSCVRLLSIQTHTKNGPVLHVAGADLVDGTPIFDIKPYIPYADCHPDATGGFTERTDTAPLAVDFPPALLQQIPEDKRAALIKVLSLNPQPGYQHDPTRRYGFNFCDVDVRFTIESRTVHVVEIVPLSQKQLPK